MLAAFAHFDDVVLDVGGVALLHGVVSIGRHVARGEALVVEAPLAADIDGVVGGHEDFVAEEICGDATGDGIEDAGLDALIQPELIPVRDELLHELEIADLILFPLHPLLQASDVGAIAEAGHAEDVLGRVAGGVGGGNEHPLQPLGGVRGALGFHYF